MKCDERALLIVLTEKSPPAYVRDVISEAHEGGWMHRKRAWYLLGKWQERGWYESGVSLDLGWFTKEGRTAAKEQNRAEAFWLPYKRTRLAVVEPTPFAEVLHAERVVFGPMGSLALVVCP